MDLVTGSSELQLIIELAVQGLRLRNYPIRGHPEPNAIPKNTKTAAERLSLLHASMQAWRTLHPFASASISLGRYEYEIGEGTFGHALKDSANQFRGLEFQRLYVEQGHGKECSSWLRYADLGINLADFSFDLSEDLLVLVEDPHENAHMHRKYVHRGLVVLAILIRSRIPKRVRILALSDRGSHPLARTMYLESPGKEPWYQCDIKISGSIVGVHFAFPHQLALDYGRLSVWNWRSGDLLHVSEGLPLCIMAHGAIDAYL